MYDTLNYQYLDQNSEFDDVDGLASYKRSGQEWSMSIILNEARGDTAAGDPFWSLSK